MLNTLQPKPPHVAAVQNGAKYVGAGSRKGRNISASSFCPLIEEELKNEIWQGCSSYKKSNIGHFWESVFLAQGGTF